MSLTTYDSEKALTVLLYLSQRLAEEKNLYKVLKAIYHANKCHLERHGRPIFNEHYQALKYGTVPALSYDILSYVKKGKPQPLMPKDVEKKISVSQNDTVTALVDPNLRALSKSDIQCLNEAIEFYKDMSFEQVRDNAHEDDAYNATGTNGFISLERIIRTLPDGELLLKHFKTA